MTLPAQLPEGLRLRRTTTTFDETTVPAGLLAAHRIADGVWGRLVVLEGSLDFVNESGGGPDGRTGESVRLDTGDVQVIPPGLVHHVGLCGPVRFHVEFHR